MCVVGDVFFLFVLVLLFISSALPPRSILTPSPQDRWLEHTPKENSRTFPPPRPSVLLSLSMSMSISDKTRQVEAVMSVVDDGAGSSKLTFAAKGSYLIWRAPVRPMQLNSQLKVRANEIIKARGRSRKTTAVDQGVDTDAPAGGFVFRLRWFIPYFSCFFLPVSLSSRGSRSYFDSEETCLFSFWFRPLLIPSPPPLVAAHNTRSG